MPSPEDDNNDVWQPRIPPEKTWWVMGGLQLVILLAALDSTIVSTALPSIVADLHGLDHYAWVATTYLLASTVTIPLYGKLGDIFGRKRILLFGIAVFLIASACCGAAQTMTQLIIARGAQGIGAGALMPIVFAIMADLFSPRERGKYQGFTGAVFGLASVVGPLAGGWITDYANWRYVFYVNLPVGFIATLVIVFLMPNFAGHEKRPKIDFLGALLLVCGLAPVLLALDWMGTGSTIMSEDVVIPLSIGFAALAAFAWHGLRAEEPIVDLRLFNNPIVAISASVVLLNGAAMMSTTFFLPFFVQGVLGHSASSTGNIMTPMMLTMVVAAVGSGQFISRRGKYKANAVIGALVANIGLALTLRLNVHSGSFDVILAMMVTGFGIGTSNSLYSTVVQNAVPYSKMGQASAKITLARQVGGTIGLAFMATLLHFSTLNVAGMVLTDSAKATFASGFHIAMMCVFGLSLIATVLALNLKQIPLRQGPSRR